MLNIDEGDLRILKENLRHYLSGFTVYAFGSRTLGNHRQWSDLDLYIVGDIPVPSELKEALSESDVAIHIDIIDNFSITEEFLQVINREELVLIDEIPG